MTKENLKKGTKYLVLDTLTDHNGALYKGDIVTLVDWNDISNNPFNKSGVVLVVEDILGKTHTVGLNDITML